ncbi:lysozyme [Phaeobacter sp. CAU 1743]|uniref:lysozyme n=1 Tax=Phaeobacter sp. CAU 1743 TaxID=3140367 RepID=UPI0023B45F88
MQLIQNWKQTAKGAWSVRLIVIACVVSAVPVFLSLVSPGLLGVDPLVFAAVAAVINALAIPARLIAQAGLSDVLSEFRRDTSGAVSRRSVGIIGAGGVALASAVAFVGQWEGLRTTAYQDVVGVWTVCYGETKGVQPGDRYTQAECDDMLALAIVSYEYALDQCLTADVPVGMKIALVSWSYNVGTGAACRSTLVRKANAGDLVGACHELPRWNRGGGRVIRGLTNRRLSERTMCLEALAGDA